MLRALRADGLGDFGSAQAAGQLSAVLFFLCGALVAADSPLVHTGRVHHLALAGIGLLAAAAGPVILFLPWRRWPRWSTLCLVPLAFTLIPLHNWAPGADGFRYGVFFLVVAAWVGLMPPRGTTLLIPPAMVAAYVLPGFFVGD